MILLIAHKTREIKNFSRFLFLHVLYPKKLKN